MPFGVTPYLNHQLQEYGTEVHMLEIARTLPDGSMDIRCRGDRIYRVENFENIPAEQGYSTAEVIFLHSNEVSNELVRHELFKELKDLMHELGDRYQLKISQEDLHSSQFIHKLGLDLDLELELLIMLDEQARQERLIQIIRQITRQMKKTNEIRRRIQLNGHFKRLDALDF